MTAATPGREAELLEPAAIAPDPPPSNVSRDSLSAPLDVTATRHVFLSSQLFKAVSGVPLPPLVHANLPRSNSHPCLSLLFLFGSCCN